MLGSFALSYHVLGEVITCVLCLVLGVNIITSFSPYELRHRLFLYADLSTFLAAFFNVFSVICIAKYKELPLALCTSISTLYFVFLLMMPLFLSCYGVDIAFSGKNRKKFGFRLNFVIYTVYLIIIFLNVKIGWVFHYDPELGYIRGPLKSITYISTALYGLITICSVTYNRKAMAKRLFIVFFIYPFLSMVIVSVQFFLPNVILTGTSSFAALLLAYISIQSDLMEYDIVTGLMNGKKLTNYIELNHKNKIGILYMLSIDNINIIQNNMETAELNEMLLGFGREFSKHFQRNSFHVTTSRFAGICFDKAQLKKIHRKIAEFVSEKNAEINSKLAYPLDVYYCAVELSEGTVSSENVTEIINNLFNTAILQHNHSLQICNQEVLYNLERKRKIFEILKRELNPSSEQFQVWFQPIYSIKEGGFSHMEALSRLQNTELGNIPPQEFVEVAENKGLIEKLGFVAFEKVCKFIADNRDVVNSVSINFSVYQMINPNVVHNVLSTIEKFGLNPSSIIMEITESLFIENYTLVRNHMQELAHAGVRFYLDDFGTGYSNLSNVVTLPFSTIKVDRSLVLLMEEDETKEQFIGNLISTFRDTGLKVLVEGVETLAQSEMVKKARVDYIQGFYYSRPLPPEKCIEVLRS